jgi:hypothetical protein
MLTVITPASPVESTWLVDRASMKTDLGISGSSSDATIDRMIAAATATLARRSDRATWASEVVEETLRPTSCVGCFYLLRRPVSAIAFVTAAGDAVDEFEVDGRKLFKLSDDERVDWDAVKTVVRYTGGYALPVYTTAPADLRDACRTLVRGKWFAQKRDPLIRGEEVPGVLRQDYWVGDAPSDDPDGLPLEIAGLCARYRYE